MSLTQARLKELLDYDPETGVFTWLERSALPQWNARFAGTRAGAITSLRHRRSAYLQISVDRRLYLAHRLAWLWINGSWPDDQIDHRDCDGLNNRLGNIRTCTSRQNHGNTRTHRRNKAGLKGVAPAGNKYAAYIQISGATEYIGTFETAEAAHAAYCKRAFEVFGPYARAG